MVQLFGRKERQGMKISKRKLCFKLKCRRILLVCFFVSAVLYYLQSLGYSPLDLQHDKERIDNNFLSELKDSLGRQEDDDDQGRTTPSTAAAAAANTITVLVPELKINTKTWKKWPAVAYEQIGHVLVYKGETFISRMRERLFEPSVGSDNTNINGRTSQTLLDEFLEVYRNRPDKVNKCGILINHALALYFSVKFLKPTLVVESGVNAGQSTYFIRKASPDTKIWALDPLEVPICGQSTRWMDENEKTTYYVGDKFVDMNQFDWRQLSANKTIDLDSTLFFLDDHKIASSRIKKLAISGAKHVIIEDNYKYGEGASSADKHGYTPKQMFVHPDRKRDAKWLFENLKAYAEFPPLVPPIMAKKATFERKRAGGFMVWQDKNEDIVAPILRPDLVEEDRKIFHDIAAKLELNPEMTDFYSYKQFMSYNQICYMALETSPTRMK